MKKIFALMMVLCMVLSFAACAKNEDTKADDTTNEAPAEGYTGDYEISVQDIPDDALLGAWKLDGDTSGGYYLFTPESKLRYVTGTTIMETTVEYGVDDAGNKSIAIGDFMFVGQSTYTIAKDVLTLVNLKEDGTFTNYTFKSTQHTPITLEAKEDFTEYSYIVGTWSNSSSAESFSFTDDGFVVMNADALNSTIKIEGTYVADYSKITIYTINADGSELKEEYPYSVYGTTLTLDGVKFYLDGQGDPNLE